jgi:hypothetical protein
MGRKGIATLVAIFIVLAAIIVIGGVFYYAYPVKAPTVQTNGAGQANQTTTTGNSSRVPSSTPVIPPATSSSLSPQSGPVGTEVTIRGNGFGAANTVTMNGLVGASMRNVPSADGKTLQFDVPGSLGPNCDPNQMCPQFLLAVTPKAYPITVVTNGMTQKIGTFTVTTR